MNDQTQVDIQNLWEIGARILPSLAHVHAEAATKVDSTRGHEAALFETPGLPAGSKSYVFSSFCELRDQLQAIARNTSINLRDSGAGCVKVADSFSQTDLNNSERLEYAENKSEIGTVKPPKNPPASPTS